MDTNTYKRWIVMSHEEMEAFPNILIFQSKNLETENILNLHPPQISFKKFKEIITDPNSDRFNRWFFETKYFIRKKDYYIHTCKLRDILV